MNPNALVNALSLHLPPVVRWSGAVARRLRQFNVAVEGKSSGYANTDALTLADLSVQELLVAALRDGDPRFRQCRIEGEESTGDIGHFSADSELAIVIDPIDGTKQYRDRTGNGYGIIVQLQSPETVLYSLVFIPETGRHGTWVDARHDRIACLEDDPTIPAAELLTSAEPVNSSRCTESKRIYMIGFQDRDGERAQAVNDAGLDCVLSDAMPGSIYPLMATGQFAGSLIHTPNIYDFPVSMHLARILGGDALWVHNREPVHFRELWMDERADMLRLPGVIACSDRRDVLEVLCDVAKDWSPIRYTDSRIQSTSESGKSSD